MNVGGGKSLWSAVESSEAYAPLGSVSGDSFSGPDAASPARAWPVAHEPDRLNHQAPWGRVILGNPAGVDHDGEEVARAGLGASSSGSWIRSPCRGARGCVSHAGTGDLRQRMEHPRLSPVWKGWEPATRPAPGSWPGWVRGLVTAGLIYHMAAVASGALGVPPSSLLERRIADLFTPYHDLVDQGYAYRYYAEPPPTPVITATLRFGDGRPAEVVRLPARGRWVVRGCGTSGSSPWPMPCLPTSRRRSSGGETAAAAGWPGPMRRHLCSTHTGCTEVTLHAQQHLIPDPDHVLEALATPGAARFDLFDEALFTSPEWIGDFTCDGS